MTRAFCEDLRSLILKFASVEAIARSGVDLSTFERWEVRAKSGEQTARPQDLLPASRLDLHGTVTIQMIQKMDIISTLDQRLRIQQIQAPSAAKF